MLERHFGVLTHTTHIHTQERFASCTFQNDTLGVSRDTFTFHISPSMNYICIYIYMRMITNLDY